MLHIFINIYKINNYFDGVRSKEIAIAAVGARLKGREMTKRLERLGKK